MKVVNVSKIITADIKQLGEEESLLVIVYLNDDDEEETFIYRNFNKVVIDFLDELNLLRLALEDQVHEREVNLH